ncbi:MAG: fluoride efflux transporter CrcB [Solirubrobacterales bacterium]
MSVLVWAGVALLGGLGAVARFAIHARVVRSHPLEFPLATFIVNITGSLTLGLLIGSGAGHDLRLLAGTGLLGAFTTFSTWMFETERMIDDGGAAAAVRGVVTSLVCGFAAVALGVWLGGSF